MAHEINALEFECARRAQVIESLTKQLAAAEAALELAEHNLALRVKRHDRDVGDYNEILAAAEARAGNLVATLEQLDDWQCECAWAETCDCMSKIQKIVYDALKAAKAAGGEK